MTYKDIIKLRNKSNQQSQPSESSAGNLSYNDVLLKRRAVTNTELEEQRKKEMQSGDSFVTQWFEKANRAVNRANGYMTNPTYNSRKNIYDNVNSEFSDLETGLGAVKSYIDKYGYTEKGAEIQSMYSDLTNAIDYYKEEAKTIQNEMSQYSNETEYNNAVNQAKYDEKYKDYDYSMLRAELDKTNSEADSGLYSYLKDKSHEFATSEDLNTEYDSLTAEWNKLYDSIDMKSEHFDATADQDKVRNRLEEIEDELDTLESLKEKKKIEEDEKKYYYDIIQNDVEASEIVQKYYELNEFNKNSSSYKTANPDEAVRFPEVGEKTPDETTKIEQDFLSLTDKGYDTEKLLKYHSRIKERERNEEKLNYMKDQAEKHPVIGSVASVPLNVYGAVGDTVRYVGAGIDKIAGGDGYIDPNSTAVAQAQAIREGASENIDSPIGKFLYDTGMSMGDFLAVLPLNLIPGVGETASMTLLGTSAGVSAANTVIENGGDIGHAITTGIVAGGAEAFFEHFSLGSLKSLKSTNPKNILGVVTNVLKQGGVEASEEGFTELANGITDWIINADLSNWSVQYDNYLKQGYSEEEAWRMTAGDFASQVGLSMAGGFVSGGVMSTGASAIGYASNKNNMSTTGKSIKSKENVSDLIKTAKTLSTDSKAYKLATKLEEQQNSGKKLSSSKVGELRSLIIKQSKTDYDAAYKEATENLHAEEKAIVDKITRDESLTSEEMKAVNNNTVLSKSVEKVKSAMKKQFVSSSKAEFAPFTSIDDNAVDKSKLNISKKGITEINDKEYTGAMEVVRTDPDTGVVTYKIEEDGKVIEITSDDVSFGTENEAYLDAIASRYNTQTAQKFIDLYEEGQDVADYTTEFNLYQNYGRLAIPLTDDKMSKGHVLNNDQKLGAYEVGVDSRKSYYQTQTIIANNAKNSKHYTYKEGTFNASAIKGIKLNETQKAFYNFLREFALRTGINIELFSSKVENGKYVGEQGSFSEKKGTIRVDINAGLKSVNKNDVKHGMLNTFSHELTHVAELGGFYEELHEAVVKAFEKQGNAFDELVDNKKKEILRNQPNEEKMSEEKLAYLADTEVIADACEIMLKDSKIFEDIAQENPGLGQKIKNALRNFINRIKEMLGSMEALTDEGIILEKCIDDLEQIQNLWDKAVTSGIKTLNATKSEQKNNTDTEDGVQYLARDNNTSIKQQLIDNLDSLNSMDIVVSYDVNYRFNGLQETKQWAVDQLKKENGIVSREGFGNVVLDKKRIKKGLSYLKTPEEVASFIAVPDIIRYGVEIDRHDKHKGRVYDTVTFAGPVEMNGQRGNVAVVIRIEENNYYKVHRIISTSGSQFVFKTKKDIAETAGGVNENSGLSPTDNVSINIISSSAEKVNKDTTKFSMCDSEYLEAVKNNDMETAQRLVDEAAEKAFAESKIRDEDGKLLKVYHGTDADFTVFDKTKGRTNMDIQGMFFSPWEIDAKGYGPNVRAFYLNITNPANESTGYKALHMFVRQNKAGVKAREHLVSLGYDGVNNENEEFISFNPEQIKSADPVTYDDNGNVIPLSERFNDNQKDIRYQMRTDGTYSNRTLLANALESSVQNEVERNLIRAYKEGISQLDEMEVKLKDVKAQIKEISFTKDSDRSQLLKLNNQKKMLANKIARKDKQLLKLESMESMQKLIALEKDKAIKRAKKKMDERVAKIRQQERERDKRVYYTSSIRKSIKNIRKLLNNSKPSKTVKQDLREPTAKLLSISQYLFNKTISNADIVRKGVESATPEEQKLLDKYLEIVGETDRELTDVEKKELYKLNSKLKDLFIREREMFNKQPVSNALTELIDAYESTKNSDDEAIRNAYDQNIAEKISDFKADIGGTLVKDMSLEQLDKFKNIVTMFYTSIRNANELFSENINSTLEEASLSVVNEINQIRGQKEDRKIFLDWISKYGWNELTPVYAFRFIGSDVLQKLYWELQHGEIDWKQDVDEAKAFKSACEEKYEYSTFDFKTKYEFTSKDRSEFELDLNQIMEIYALSRREQGLQHLLNGGFTYSRDAVDNKGNVKSRTKAYPLTIETVKAISDKLSDNQKHFVEEMQNYLSTVMAQKGNEVSMKLYGVKLFNEPIYWNISSSDVYTKVDVQETKGEFSLKESGFTKATVRNASNPIALKGFEESWCNHVNQMSLYHALTLPMENFTKILNYNFLKKTDENIKTPKSVRGAIINAFGDSAEKYIRDFLKDVNGGIQDRARFGLADTIVALDKKSSTFMKLSVILQQPTAVVRAMAYVDPIYFAKATGKSILLHKHRKDWEQLKKYAPVAGIKEMGSFDTGMSKGVIEWLSSGKRDSRMKKIHNKVDNALTKAPALMDEISWVYLWHAIQKETYAKHGLAVGTEENLVKSGERFNEVVNLTQVYDSVFAHSGYMRSKQTHDKMLTAYMAEPTIVANMMVDAVVQAKRGGKSGKKRLIRVVTAVVGSIVFNSILRSIATAFHDEDEDEAYSEKYLQALGSNLKSDLNPITYIPFFRDVISVLKGYDIERMDMALISDLVDACSKASKESLTIDEAIDLVGSVFNLSGFHIKNLAEDIYAIVKTFRNENIFFDLKNTIPQSYQEAYDKYWKEGYSEDDCETKAKTSVKAKIRSNLKPLYIFSLKNGDFDTIKTIRSYMREAGYYGSLSKVDDTLKDWREQEKEAEEREKIAQERK